MSHKFPKIVGSRWFTPGPGVIGIVIVEIGPGERRSYIGSAEEFDREQGAQVISNYGASFPLKEAESLIFGRHVSQCSN